MPKKSSQSNRTSQMNSNQNNRANQMNPNNPAYHQSRGLSTRPDNFTEISQKRSRQGQLEYRANQAACVSQDTRRAIGRDTQRVEKVAKEVLGPSAMIYKGGSQFKRTNIGATADNDLKIKVDKPVTWDDRQKLGKGLEREFGKGKVDSRHAKIHVVKGEGSSIDVLPTSAEYFPQNFKLDKLGSNAFSTNSTGRNAVRIIKQSHQGKGIYGKQIENAVLETQQQNRGIDLEDLIAITERKLRI